MAGYSLKNWVGKVGKLEIFEVNVRDDSKDIAKALREHGMHITAAQVKKNVDYLSVHLVNSLAEGAVESIYNKIPWDTDELGGEHIHVTKATEKKPISSVYIDDKAHYGSKRNINNPEEASGLAIFLDEPVGPNDDLHRTEPSHDGSIGAGAPTDDWIADAQIDFQKRKRDILRDSI